MFKITLKDNTFVNVDKEQAEMIVESLFEHVSGIRLLEADEVEARQEIADRLAAKGISLDSCEAMGFEVDVYDNDMLAGDMLIKVPHGSILVEYTEFGDHVVLADSYFNNNEKMPISGGDTINDLIADAEDQIQYISDKYPEEDTDIALLAKVVKDWKSIAMPVNEDAEPDLGNLDLETEEPDSTLVTECTTSGAVTSVALPVGTPADPIKKPKVKVKRI